MAEPDETTVGQPEKNGFIDLRLYVVGKSPRCLEGYENLVRICEMYAAEPYRITVIDLALNPKVARDEQITAIPTLIRQPRREGHRKIIGTLSDERKVVGELDLAMRSIGHVHAPAAL